MLVKEQILRTAYTTSMGQSRFKRRVLLLGGGQETAALRSEISKGMEELEVVGEFDLNDTDKSKNTGLLYPAAMLVIDKEGQLQIDLNQNSWKLLDVLDWKGTPGVN